MDEAKVSVQVERDANYFSITANSFILGSPLPGEMIQIDIGEDFASASQIEVVGVPSGDDGFVSIANPRLVIETVPCRVLYGRMKVGLEAAEQLIGLLQQHVEVLKKIKRPQKEG